jgi:hypothetical protein
MAAMTASQSTVAELVADKNGVMMYDYCVKRATGRGTTTTRGVSYSWAGLTK